MRLTYASAAFAGFFVGALPVAIYTFTEAAWRAAQERETPFVVWFWDTATISLIFGVLGFLGGLVFRRVVGESPRVEPVDVSIFK